MASASETSSSETRLGTSRPAPETLLLRLEGAWTVRGERPAAEAAMRELKSGIRQLRFDTEGLTDWDSRILTFLLQVITRADALGVEVDRSGLPAGMRGLLDLATAVPERKGARREARRESLLARFGGAAINFWRGTLELLDFTGEVTVAFLRMWRGKARFRGSDLFLIIQKTGADALPIVSLISVLVGLILAFVGAVQLSIFGAQIYVASLVGVAMVRVMGAVMAGIIMAGRTGAAFAAELGTMQVNEEIDALKTMGISPMEFLVLPRMLALTLMMPLLCVYADIMGILGGFIVGVTMLNLSPMEYLIKTQETVGLANLWIGVFHSFVFGILVALTGCLQGIKCGRSASSVGAATTSAVVSGIVAIIVATAIITVACNVIGI